MSSSSGGSDSDTSQARTSATSFLFGIPPLPLHSRPNFSLLAQGGGLTEPGVERDIVAWNGRIGSWESRLTQLPPSGGHFWEEEAEAAEEWWWRRTRFFCAACRCHGVEKDATEPDDGARKPGRAL